MKIEGDELSTRGVRRVGVHSLLKPAALALSAAKLRTRVGYSCATLLVACSGTKSSPGYDDGLNDGGFPPATSEEPEGPGPDAGAPDVVADAGADAGVDGG